VSAETCATCGANMRRARFEHHNVVKGGEDWSDILACTNERCRDYVKPTLWWDSAPPFGNDRRDRTMRPHTCASCGRDIFKNENGSLYEDLKRHQYHTKESCLTRQRDELRDRLSLIKAHADTARAEVASYSWDQLRSALDRVVELAGK
jgi:hypothetical protein